VSETPNDGDRDETGSASEVGVAEALRALPLCSELYLGMQAMNVGMVDAYLEQLEAELLAEYMATERTPTMSAMFVSAVSQMWILALYEFLRTWRQRAKEILAWATEFRALSVDERAARLKEKRAEVEKRAAEPLEVGAFYWGAYEAAATAADFADELRRAVDKTERLFRRIEALRITLAKHEVPREAGSIAMAPGYGRIDMPTGSIYWQVALGGNEVDIVSRAAIAEDCRRLAEERELFILPVPAQEIVSRLPNESYGVKRIAVTLDDGATYSGVRVAWSKEVLFVEGHDEIPFDVSRVVDVQHDPSPENQ
jgi:hypothetical protein